MTTSAALIAAAIATGFLASIHLVLPRARARLDANGESIAAAIGGGVAAAYVFVHLLPEIARGNEHVAEALDDPEPFSAMAEIGLFLIAFAGFVVLYGLDHLASQRNRSGSVFRVHLGVFAVYNAVITYSLPTQFEAGATPAALFTLAMGVHFVLSDRSLTEHHEEKFARVGRPVLVGALVIGFVLAWILAPTRNLSVSALLALLGGFVLYNVFSDELPSEREVRFPAFAAAAGVYGALLVVVASSSA